jgi:hypothetical protein
MGNPFLNRTVDGFLKIGAVGACKVAAEETFECLHRGACVRPPLPRPLYSYSVSVMLHSIAPLASFFLFFFLSLNPC